MIDSGEKDEMLAPLDKKMRHLEIVGPGEEGFSWGEEGKAERVAVHACKGNLGG